MKKKYAHSLRAMCLAISTITAAFAQSSTCGNLVFNGDFETYNPPIRGYLSNVSSPNPNNSGDELTGWQSTNTYTPDYYNINSPSYSLGGSQPSAAPYGAFAPYNNSAGAIGLVTYSRVLTPFTNYPEEYIAGTLTSPLDGGYYYASMQVRSATSSQIQQFAHIGIDITVGSAVDYSSPFPYKLFTPSGCGIQSNGYITNTSNWSRVSGIFQGIPGAQHINIGNFDPYNSLGTVNPTEFAYAYIDQVEVYKIPTAGSNISCLNSPIVLGEGCAIPGAKYVWTRDDGSIFSTSLHPTVSPSTPSNYTLTVTLPDQSTYSSSVYIDDCNCTNQMYAIDREDDNYCTNGFGTIYYCPVYDAGPYDPAYAGTSGFTWSVTGQAYGDFLMISPISGRLCIPVVPNRNFIQTNYEVTMTYHYANGCTATFTNGQGFDASVCYPYRQTYSVTPNPATSQLTIARELSPEATSSTGKKLATAYPPIEMRLYNSFGKLVKEGKGTTDQLVLDVQDLPNGIYYLRSGAGKNTVSKAIEVRH